MDKCRLAEYDSKLVVYNYANWAFILYSQTEDYCGNSYFAVNISILSILKPVYAQLTSV